MAGAPGEFDLIARIRARAGTRDDVVLGIGDDAAILRVPAGRDLVVSTDTLNAGVHFPVDTSPSAIGWKALAVSLSDLAAMGAEPAWCTLNLTLPQADGAWLDAFLDGFLALAATHRVALVGGDTTRGTLSVTVTIHGLVPRGQALCRRGATMGDEIWICGTLGDAAAGLRLLAESGRPTPEGAKDGARLHRESFLLTRLERPAPRVGFGIALRGIATSCIDLSDGLLADLGHILEESGVGAEIDLATLPASDALRDAIDAATRIDLQLAGGDDYELCFTVAPSRALDVRAAALHARVAVACIGHIEKAHGLRLRDAQGAIHATPPRGYQHFERP